MKKITMEPISNKMNKNPYIELIEYKEFLRLIAERLESIKGLISWNAIHEIINIQSLMLNQVKIMENKKWKVIK